MTPLWLLKYLPNMPASHIAIFNDLRGPSNSLTVREASGHIAAGEAAITIKRGAADVVLAGSTGTRIHPMKMVHAILNEQVALGDGAPENWSRPFDQERKGMVLGEGAARSGGANRSSILADVMEAVIGAVYLDGGLSRAESVVEALLSDEWKSIDPALLVKDPKTELQEFLQKCGRPYLQNPLKS